MSGFLKRSELTESKLVDELANEIRRNIDCRLLVNEPLSSHTSFRIGGPATFYAIPKTVAATSKLIRFCNKKGIRIFIIGYGTNLLVSDRGFAGCVVDLAEASRDIRIEESRVFSGAGVWGGDLVRKVCESGLSGLQKLSGIPGSVGAWLAINAGAFRSSISENAVQVEVLDYQGNESVLSKQDCRFGYREAKGLENKIVAGGRFDFEFGDRETILRESEEIIVERYRRNVMTLPSSGSVFKNPPGQFAAKLTESVGAKGTTSGGVEVSPRHSNFIVNKRGGTAQDVLNLIHSIREKVMDRFGIELELELKLLGFEDE